MTKPTRLAVLLMDWSGDSQPTSEHVSDPVREGWEAALRHAHVDAELVRVALSQQARESTLERGDAGATFTGATFTDGGADWWQRLVEALALTDEDLVLVSEATSLPSPAALTRMLSTYDAQAGAEPGRGGVLVDARVLPTEVRAMLPESTEDTTDDPAADPTEDPTEDPAAGDAGGTADASEEPDSPDGEDQTEELLELEDEPLPPVGPYLVSGACSLLDVRAFRRLGAAWESSPQDGAGERLEELVEAADVRIVPEPGAAIFRRVRVDSTGHPLRLDAARSTPPVPAPRASGSLHPAHLPATSLSAFLRTLGITVPGTAEPEAAETQRPFLSIITRTQGTRGRCLEDVLTCLAAQTDRDFELLVMCHRAAPAAVEETRQVLAAFPSWLTERTRLVEVERPGRSAPLNDGFELARGRYLVMLDDDDTVLEHWVETFHRAEEQAEGRLLRSVALLQPVRADPSTSEFVPRAVAPIKREWPLHYEMVDHLRANYSPCMTIAFPRGTFHDLSLRFDESLNTTEDWDLIVRSAGVVGVHSAPEITSVYRWWGSGSSREEHDKSEWDDAMHRVLDKFDEVEMLMPPHAFERFRTLIKKAQADATKMNDQAREFATRLHHTNLRLAKVLAERDKVRERAQRLSEKLEKRTGRQEQRLALLRETDLLLAQHPDQRPEGSIVDLTPQELQELLGRLRSQPSGRRGWLPGRRAGA
ncbi:glycosyltransferase family 2 protein [Nocardioides houyundeii]|uniref:glycosyltransferase family 2 protein n=1 Tax=Nocardioides houyundeii TaxID=2045452 RepID=UPI0013B38F01|nr:glycosyltransferase family A protein [Nocardioides houyundeii]